MTTSFWGDESLKFRHTRMEDDLELKPEWEPFVFSWSFTEELGEQVVLGTGEAYPGTGSCPFSYLFE